jgi:hypothetical protein
MAAALVAAALLPVTLPGAANDVLTYVGQTAKVGKESWQDPNLDGWA